MGINVHLAGVASGGVTGVPRMKELLSVTRNIKAPSVKVYFDDYGKEHAKEIHNRLETTHLKDILISSRIYYDKNDLSTDIEDDQKFLEIYKGFLDNEGITCDDDHPWLLRFEFDREKMFNLGLTMLDVDQAIYNFYRQTLHCNYSDDNASKLIYRIRIAEPSSDDVISELKALETSLVNMIVKGVKNVKKVIMQESLDLIMRIDESNNITKKKELMLFTYGTNLLEILGIKGVDATRTISNDIHEINDIFGIEATREALVNEILDKDVLGDLVNYRHVSVLVDTMTSKGGLLSIDRHGINRSDIGPLAKCSFEETTDMLTKASIFSEVDNMRGVSANIMFGQQPMCGTSDSMLILDEDLNIEKHSVDDKNWLDNTIDWWKGDEDMKKEICKEEALTFNYSMPLTTSRLATKKRVEIKIQ
jgi:DNA-directed RNA polymerase II subunit RPB1